MIEECFQGNESSADIWLVRANVYIQLHEFEIEQSAKNSKYVIRWADAIITANESFYKVLELKPDIKVDPSLIDPKDGQLLSATPIHQLARKNMKNNDWEEAIRLLNIVIRSYKVAPKEYAEYLGYAYVDLADCYKATGEEENYKKTLVEAAKMSLIYPHIYLNLYDIYKHENDTVKCSEILTQAHKLLPDEIDIKYCELDFYAMIRDTAKLKNAASNLFEQYKDSINVINNVALYLINSKEYLLAEEMLQTGLEIAPNDFDLNQLMGYRYNREALDYIDLKDAKLAETPRKYKDAEAALNKSNEIFTIALIWAEKAYNINQDDRDNNVMLSRIYVRLQLPVPEELQKKVDSYYQK
jgi:hypothetical protein